MLVACCQDSQTKQAPGAGARQAGPPPRERGGHCNQCSFHSHPKNTLSVACSIAQRLGSRQMARAAPATGPTAPTAGSPPVLLLAAGHRLTAAGARGSRAQPRPLRRRRLREAPRELCVPCLHAGCCSGAHQPSLRATTKALPRWRPPPLCCRPLCCPAAEAPRPLSRRLGHPDEPPAGQQAYLAAAGNMQPGTATAPAAAGADRGVRCNPRFPGAAPGIWSRSSACSHLKQPAAAKMHRGVCAAGGWAAQP